VIQEQAQTAAARKAIQNWELNCRELSKRQPGLASALNQAWIEPEWVFGRDGSLTARLDDGWWSGCSLPSRAAESILRKLEFKGSVACFISPAHAAQIRFALGRMGTSQALMCVIPDLPDLRITLGCESFEAGVAAGRLWFVSGEDWPNALAELLHANDGVPTPAQFIRTNLTEAQHAETMMAQADAVIQQENARRSDLVRSILTSRTSSGPGAVLAVISSGFRLWDDAGGALHDLARAAKWATLDVDDPRRASALAFARAAAESRAIVMANGSRAELPSSLPSDLPVISWVTWPRIPQFDRRCPADALILTEPSWRDTALRAGWPDDRIIIGTWPPSTTHSTGTGLAIIADTCPIQKPTFEMSSHGLLWDTIASELSSDPFQVGKDAAGYLSRWCARAGIDEQTLDRRTFIERLIVPAYQQALARALLQAGIELRLHGRGWNEFSDLSQQHAGEIANRDGLRAAIDSAAALVHIWPIPWTHPIEAAGQPVLRITGSRASWIQEARRLATGAAKALTTGGKYLTAKLIDSLLA
jgi:hypothetical protein